VYRCFIEGLCGLRGVKEGLSVDPKMPSEWNEMKATRLFRNATFEVEIEQMDVKEVEVVVDGKKIEGNVIKDITGGKTYKVGVKVPKKTESGVRV
jgi:cellobionic acid phosphorylase